MADNHEETGDVRLPPKLDLRKDGMLKTEQAVSPPKTTAEPLIPADAPSVAPAVSPVQAASPAPTPKVVVPAPRPASPPTPLSRPVVSESPATLPGTGIAAAAAAISTPGAPGAPATGSEKSEAKKKTSRIPLEAAKPLLSKVPLVQPEASKTIRIKPAAGPAAKISGVAGAGQEPVAAAVEAAKSQTSRISLEDVLGADTGGAKLPEGGPKTVRLKRPSDVGSAKVGVLSGSGLDKTAAEGATMTQRKTIRIKRSGSAGEAPKAAIARPATGEQPVLGHAAIEQPSERVNVFFPLAAAAAIVVTGVFIYLLCTQAVGPNSSLTKLSYGGGLDLSWPGKIAAQR